jgi:preprotein translocase subunit SecB
LEAEDVNLVAAARVAKRVDLQEVRLIAVSATADAKAHGPLHPSIDHDCVVTSVADAAVDVTCSYRFVATTGQSEVAQAEIKYLLSYSVRGEEPIDDDDLAHFAFANGTYHSWPFARQLVFGLTSNMGYAPYTLPVFKFNPKPKEVPAPANETLNASDSSEYEEEPEPTGE